MKNIAKKFLVCTLLVFMLAGCGNEGNKQTPGGKLTLSIFLFDLVPFNDDYPIYKKAEELTEVSIKGILSQSTSDGFTALNLMISSGNLADIIHMTAHANGRNDFYRLGTEGVLVPLNEYIESNAPNFKKFLEERPDVKKYITAPDGNIYYIPFVPDGTASKGWFIRKDWLDKLGLGTPQNIDEFYQVMKAFKERDPNDNQIADEVPYFSRDAAVGRETAVTDLFSFWNVNKSFMLRDDTVVYSPLLPAFKEAVKTVSAWYKEGLIDNEIYTRGSNAREYMLGNNLGGITHDWFPSTAEYNTKLRDQIPGLDFVPFVPIQGSDGVRREMDSRNQASDSGWGISSSNKHPDATIRWMDFWFSEEGSRLMNYGIEGEDYDIIDGKPVFKEEVLQSSQNVADYLKARGAQGNVGFHQDINYELQWTNAIALKGIEEYTNGGYIQKKLPALVFNQQEQNEYDVIIKGVESYRDEMLQKWILGSENIDETYDAFIAELKNRKVDRLVEIQQEAYERYREK